MSYCNWCGHPIDDPTSHDCPESHPKPDVVDRLREDHCDTLECEHGFNLYERGGCPNVVCLGRDLREASEEIERLRGGTVYLVAWINHQYQDETTDFSTEAAARTFIDTERANVRALYRAELIESFDNWVAPVPGAPFLVTRQEGSTTLRAFRFPVDPQHGIELGSVVVIDHLTGKLRPAATDDTGQTYYLPANARFTDDGHVEWDL